MAVIFLYGLLWEMKRDYRFYNQWVATKRNSRLLVTPTTPKMDGRWNKDSDCV